MFAAIQPPSRQRGGGFLTGARNALGSALGCPQESRLFPGEKHAQLGRCNASYMGPGTAFLTRADRGDEGRGPIDGLCSYNHDLSYQKAGIGMYEGQMTKTQAGDAVRAADQTFLGCVDRYRRTAPVNARIATGLFRAKMQAEDAGVLGKAKIAELSTRNITELTSMRPDKVQQILTTRREGWPPTKALAKLRKQTGMGLADDAMRAAVRTVQTFFQAAGKQVPTLAQIPKILKTVIKARQQGAGVAKSDPTYALQRAIHGGSWAGTASNVLGVAGMIPSPLSLPLEGVSGLLALGDAIFG